MWELNGTPKDERKGTIEIKTWRISGWKEGICLGETFDSYSPILKNKGLTQETVGFA